VSSSSSSSTTVADNDNKDSTASKNFLEIRNQVEKAHSASLIHRICCDINKVGTSVPRILEVLCLHANNIRNSTSPTIDPRSPTIVDRRQVLLSNFDLAFQQPYKVREGHGALNTLVNFLDVQWAAAWEMWDPKLKRSQSICGSIVQSSCTGKSRLIERYKCARAI
jgi:hypothetical protein